jgi:1-acyl-sn-glycerol-3-phosphate acyltransferase
VPDVSPRTTPTTRASFHDEGYGYDIFGLHPPTLQRTLDICAPLYDSYFRVSSSGIERVPTDGPVILVANHAGVLPVDAAMLCFDVLRRLQPPRIPRAMADRFVPKLPLVSTLFARCGVVSGTRANAGRLLERGELLAIWPEGVTGPAKRFRDRYRIQGWRVGFAELAIRHRAPIVPVAIIGPEESWPLATKLAVHWFGSPYLPLPAWPLPLPTHYHILYGAPIYLHLEHTAADAHDPDFVAAAAARVHDVLARQIEDARMVRRGLFR